MDDYRFTLLSMILSTSEEGKVVLKAPETIRNMLSKITIPRDLGGAAEIVFEERVKQGRLRLLGHDAAPAHQGYLALALELDGDVEGVGKTGSCSATVTVHKPVIVRARMQPYFHAGRIYLQALSTDVVQDLEGNTPPKIEGDCYYGTAATCDSRVPSENKLLEDLRKSIQKQVQGDLLPFAGQLLRALVSDKAMGGWLFGRDAALEELDVARDVVPGQSATYGGDQDPADVIEAIRVVGVPKGAGWAAVHHQER
jgi:hypothetical protein